MGRFDMGRELINAVLEFTARTPGAPRTTLVLVLFYHGTPGLTVGQ